MLEGPNIERFFLLGEAPRRAAARFVHLELLDDRSRPANWTIAPHAHQDLHHVFLVEEGGGWADADGRVHEIAAPCIVVVPAGVVHGFRWDPSSIGRVLTFSDQFMRTIAEDEPRIAELFERSLWTATRHDTAIDEAYSRLDRELGWAAAGHGFALSVQLSAILLEVLRMHVGVEHEELAPAGPQALLVARYRAFVNAHYREHPSVQDAARRIGVSESRLRAACREVADTSPTRILHERLRLEAERVMSYSNMTIAQIASYLGFSDPAYFSRFFTREAGVSPRAFRRKGQDARERL